MGFLRFWSDLNMWNKFGIAVVGAVAIIGVIAWLLP